MFVGACAEGRAAHFETRAKSITLRLFIVIEQRCPLIEAVWPCALRLLTLCLSLGLPERSSAGLRCRYLCPCQIEIAIQTPKWHFLLLFYHILPQGIPLVGCSPVLERRSTPRACPVRFTDRWSVVIGPQRHRKDVPPSNNRRLALLIHRYAQTGHTKLHCYIFLSLLLQSFLYILIDRVFLLDYSVWFDLRDREADLIAQSNFLVTKGTCIFERKDVMKTRLVHVMVALDKL